MSEVYVFSADDEANDYDTLGLAGPLTPTKVEFKETANGESIVTMTHPIDEFDRYLQLENDNILVVPVPVRTTPEIDENGHITTTVWTTKIIANPTKAQRTLYKKQSTSNTKKKKRMKAGDAVTIVWKSEDTSKRWKAKTKYGTGWVNSDAVEELTQHTIADNSESIQTVCSPWTVMDQYFRIYEVKKSIKEVEVSARHISYDLLYNVTRYETNGEVGLQAAINGVLNNCYGTGHGFVGHTNVTNKRIGLFYNGKNPIDAFLDPEEGICAKFDVGLIRDNNDLYFLHDPGINRGVVIRYGKNMTGVDFTYSEDEVVTRIIPIGEKKNGDELYLHDTDPAQRYIDISSYVSSYNTAHPNATIEAPSYAVPHIHWLKCDNCKVGSDGVTKTIALNRMREQANKLFEDGCYNPKIQMKVEFINLGDTEEYSQFKHLEDSFLFDYIIVQHPELRINVTAQIVSITWDCMKDRMTAVEIGSVGETMANAGITTWQIPSGFSGSKLATGSVGANAIGKGTIVADHIQANTINAGHVNASTVTTDELYATLAHIIAVEINNATIENVNINHADVKDLAAELANIATLKAQEADIDKAYIDNAEIDEEHVQKLYAAWAEITKAGIDQATIEYADINQALIDWASIDNMTAQNAAIAKATAGSVYINEANIDWAKIATLCSQLANVAELRAEHATIDTATINQVTSTVTNTVTLTAQNADLEFATAQRLVTSAMIMDQGVGGTLTIKNLIATSAMFVQATMGTLVLKGEDDEYYNVSIAADGMIHTEKVVLEEGQTIDQYATAHGKQIVETEAVIDELNSTNIRAQSAIMSTIFTAALQAEVISASQAFLASATIPQLYATSIAAIGDSLDLSANESIKLVVGGVKVGGRNYMRYSKDMIDDEFHHFVYDPVVDDFLVNESYVE